MSAHPRPEAVAATRPRAPADCRYWVFDMDGTLTVAVHDFALIRRELAIGEDEDILHHLAALPVAEAARKRAWLMEHERGLAEDSVAAPGACELVRELHRRGCGLAILTRNDHALAQLTLEEIGLRPLFDAAAIVGRDEAPPKPHPGGLLELAARWGVAPGELVMVGDHAHDLQCGRNAGATTVLVGPLNPWPELADHHALDCGELLRRLG